MQTSRLDVFQQESYEVWRRYNDFDWLHRQLLKAHPTLIIPVKTELKILDINFMIASRSYVLMCVNKCVRVHCTCFVIPFCQLGTVHI